MPNETTTENPSPATSGVVVAKEAIVVVVGARPRKYGRIVVKHKRTQQEVEIDDTDNPPIDEGDIGTDYTFREGQRGRADHPAVLACPPDRSDRRARLQLRLGRGGVMAKQPLSPKNVHSVDR